MGDNPAKLGSLGELGVHMQGVMVSRRVGLLIELFLADGLHH